MLYICFRFRVKSNYYPDYYRDRYIGPVAEWLGSALQKLLQRFESARDLKKRLPILAAFFNLTPKPRLNLGRDLKKRLSMKTAFF